MFEFLSIADLEHMPEPRWLVEGLFEQDAMVMLVGPPGSFKSFLAIDWGLSLAVGRPWNGRATEPSRVLYALGEGKASLLKRIQAWVTHNKLDRNERERLNANFRITFNVPQLAVPREATAFTEHLEKDGFNPTMLIIDTLARSYVGKDENNPMDAGVWVESVDRLRKRGMTVLILHHTKKNTEFGLKYRGTTAFLGAVDTSFVLERNPEGFRGLARLTCDKQKDHMEPQDVWMKREHIRPADGKEGYIVMVEVEKPGLAEEVERDAERAALDGMIESLLNDADHASDRSRARALSEVMGIAESAAQSKISRARRKRGDAEPELQAGKTVRMAG